MPRSRSQSPVRRSSPSKSDLISRLDRQCKLASDLYSATITHCGTAKERNVQQRLDHIQSDCQAQLRGQPTSAKPSELLLQTDEIFAKLTKLGQTESNLMGMLSPEQFFQLRQLEQVGKPKTIKSRMRLYSCLDADWKPTLQLVVMIVMPTADWHNLHF